MYNMQEQYLEQAIQLARKAEGLTAPNPTVGAVFVKNGKVIGKGYHRVAGTDHAEIRAIKDAKKNGYDIAGATLYVTLEPCSHYGKTPPCADVIVKAGVQHVVVGMQDAFRLVDGGGLKKLRAAGVKVEILKKHSILAKQVRLLNQPFIKWASTALPYVTMKAAVSMDGKIATRNGDSKWITCEAARQDSRIERSRADAVLVGAGTVHKDDPELAAHGIYKKKTLLRIIIDDRLSVPTSKYVFRDTNVFVATTDMASKGKIAQYTKKGIAFRSFGKKKVSIKKLLQYLGKQEIQHVYIEGGAGVHGSFHDEALTDPLAVDRVLWYMNPRIIGGVHAKSAVGGKGVATMSDHLVLKHLETEVIGGDFKISARVTIY